MKIKTRFSEHPSNQGWRVGVRGWRGQGSRMLCFTFNDQKSEIRSPYISPCFLLSQEEQQVSHGCSDSATPPGGHGEFHIMLIFRYKCSP
uniref:Uncharacterized protein n=1 Tax=Mastacembelus armatus TaxID=205130 RepID=A0A7N8XM95_9TELE